MITVTAAFASPQNKREFAQWYNDQERGGRLRYITETDKFELYDGENWNHITEGVLFSDFKKFFKQKQKAIKYASIKTDKPILSKDIGELLPQVFSVPLKAIFGAIPGILTLSFIGFFVYTCASDTIFETEEEKAAREAARRSKMTPEERAEEDRFKDWLKKAEAEIAEKRRREEAENAKLNKELMRMMPCAHNASHAREIAAWCNHKYQKQVKECTWKGLSPSFCEASLNSALNHCIRTCNN